jgi:hypothetical protein
MPDIELKVIEQQYGSEPKTGYIKWRQGKDDISQPTAPLDLEKTAFVQTRKARPNQPRNVETIREVPVRCVQSRRISVKEQFKDKDRFNHTRVTPIGFA